MTIPTQRCIALHKLFVFVIALLMSNMIFALPVSQTDTLINVSNEVVLRVLEAGSSDAQTIVLIPGWCFTADIWHKQIEALRDSYHIIAIDPRSQGRSTILNHSNSPDDRAADIATLIKKLHLQKPVLVGSSQGVQDVAAYVLANGTEDIGGIVFVDAVVSTGTAEVDSEFVATVLGRLPLYVNYQREYLEGMMSYIFKNPLSPSELNTIVSAALQTPTSIGVANIVLDFFGKDYRPAFKRINVPTLMIVAGTAPDKNAQLQQQIPNLTTVVIEGAGHIVFYDEPVKFNNALLQFLKKQVEKRK